MNRQMNKGNRAGEVRAAFAAPVFLQNIRQIWCYQKKN